ncbi:hypothetical protein GGR56DRAFT_92214 [Xylariaceae sp. FL0804]|nr:hypothetical protein GGR56DRAFT_92214 [Xylariaceae sp. FL0804]
MDFSWLLHLSCSPIPHRILFLLQHRFLLMLLLVTHASYHRIKSSPRLLLGLVIEVLKLATVSSASQQQTRVRR